MLGLAVNVIDCPGADGFVPEVIAIDTAGVTVDSTVIVIVLDATGAGLAQDKLDVMTQLTCCPFVNELVENIALLVPEGLLPTIHW